MRVIKIRVWDHTLQRMYLPAGFGAFQGCICSYKRDPMDRQTHEFETMLYTGLKDATQWEDLSEEEREAWTRDGNMPSEWNGREIYEGDILEVEGLFIPIEYERGSFWLGQEPLHEFGLSLREVLGNIYENPELLSEPTST